MDLEDHEGFNKTTNYHPNPYKSSSTKKYHAERSSIFNLNVPLSEKNLTQFLNSFEKTKSVDTQLEFLNSLSRASPDTAEKFAETGGLAILARILIETSRSPYARPDLVDRILSYLNKIILTKNMLTASRIHAAVEVIKNSPDVTEDQSNKTFKLLIKWRETINDWLSEGGERQAQEYEREKRISRTFIKRTSRYDRNSGDKNGSVSSDDRSSDSSKRLSRDHKRMIKPRFGNFPHQKDRRYQRDSKYSRRRSDHDSDSDGDYNNSRKKSVVWIDDNLVQFKYFRINDEPAHRGLTEDEVQQIQDNLLDETKALPAHLSPEDIKHKESQMEGRSLKMRKDTEKEIQNKLNAMVETISWYRPKRLDMVENVQYGKESIEVKEYEKRIQSKLPCFYLKEYQIPEQPSYDNLKNTKKGSVETVNVPLANSVTEGEPEESQDLFRAIEDFVSTELPGAPGTTTTGEKRANQPQTTQPPAAEEKKEAKPAPKKSQPIKGILKKSKEQLEKEREEEAQLEEERRKEKERRAAGLDSEVVMKLLSGEATQEEQEEIIHTLKETGDADGLLQNIATLKQFMINVSHTGKPKKKDKFPPNQSSQYMPEPRKMMKMNTEPQSNLLSNPPPRHHHQQQHHHQDQIMSPPFDQNASMDDDDDDYHNQHGRQKMKKMPFRPNNYKTVPCVWFHSPRGCPYGDTCNFIHDQNHPGRQTPNMHKYVRPIDQLHKKDELEAGLSPNPGFSPSLSNEPPQSNFFPNNPEPRPANVSSVPEGGRMGMDKPPNHFMNRPGNPNVSHPPNTFNHMNQPHGSNMHHNPNPTPTPAPHMNPSRNPNYMHPGGNHGNQVPYDNRMGGGHHMNPNMHNNHPSQPTHGNHPPYMNQRGGHNPRGGRGGYRGRGQSHHNPSMMTPPEHNNFRNNNMMFQHGNNRMPQNPYPMHMPQMGGFNPHMMPPKGVMPPQGPGYGLMDMNKNKE